MAADMKRPQAEIYTSEIAPVLAEIRYAKRHLGAWMKPRQVKSSLFNFRSRSCYAPKPYGRALIIGPWNYPFGLVAAPAVHALAAGNRVLLKPSEYAPATTAYVASALRNFFTEDELACTEGGPQETAGLIRSGADIVFFTGGTSTGRKIMEVCSANLTPVVLELGGCNPCIVDARTDLTVAAHRVCWGKFFNAGQTCLAPNACYVHESIAQAFLAELHRTLERFYGPHPRESNSFGRIINEHHCRRLEGVLGRLQGKVVTGGEVVREELFIAPTIIDMANTGSLDIDEEIFGPILPVFSYRHLEDLLEQLSRQSLPLVVSCFSSDPSVMEQVRQRTRSGSLIFNGALELAASHTLPFGGIGGSGMGRYHGKFGFDAFSYRRAELIKPLRPEFGFNYPPYRKPSALVRKAMDLLLR
jgi:aldehyde dehydrogenase (NAD+)